MEALAVIGLVSAIVQFVDFSTKVLAQLDNFRSQNNELPMIFRDIKVQLPLLLSDLKQTKDQVERQEINLDTRKAVLAVVQRCHSHVQALDEILRKILPDSSDSSWRLAKKALLSVQQEDKIRIIAKELRNNVIYLTHHSASSRFQGVTNIYVAPIQADEQLKMLQWLSSIDPSAYHNRALEQREPGTGQWLLQSEKFCRWRDQSKGLAWLHGIPGCGKTLLCAAAIEAIKDHCQHSSTRALSYYYFDFNNAANIEVSMILRSVIKQICSEMHQLPEIVQKLCAQHRASGQQPSVATLLSILQTLEQDFNLEMFMMLDALDEYPQDGRSRVLETIQSLVGSNFRRTHVFVTSRAEHDVEFVIGKALTENIGIEHNRVDADIKTHVRSRLAEDPRLSRLPDHIKGVVELKLSAGAHGMFRWAICQLETLRACNKASAVKKALDELPETLYDTYERILSSIDHHDRSEARAVMQWLAFSKRPLAIEEAAEAATIQPGLEKLDPDDKLYDPYEVLRICRTLVSLSEENVSICGKLESRQIVRFAHVSVREYLLSKHILQGSVADFAIASQPAHETLAQCCLSVLLRNNCRHIVNPDPRAIPLLSYAAEFWFQHVRENIGNTDGKASDPKLLTSTLMNGLFHTSVTVFQNWLTVYDPNIGRGHDRLRGFGPSPLYYAALLGLEEPTKELLDLGYDIDALGGKYGTALVAASRSGNEAMVQLLLKHGADVNCYGGLVHGNPLEAACFSGSTSIVRLLIEKGAMINANRRQQHDTPLQVACQRGDAALVEILICSGADVNLRGGGYAYALQAAAERGRAGIVVLLLRKGADVNARGGFYGSALQAAASCGAEDVARILLDAGADPNAQQGGFRDALRAAAVRQNQSIFNLLIERGANVDLTVRQLLEGNAVSDVSEKNILAEEIQTAWVKRDRSLMYLVQRAARSIADKQIQERKTRDLEKASQQPAQDKYERLRKAVQFSLKQDSDQYREAAIPATWLLQQTA